MEPKKILLVEDDAASALIIEKSLLNLNYQLTETVETGDAAIASCQQNRPDLILMDIFIEGKKDGISTAEFITSSYEIPVVFLTGSLDYDVMERAKRSNPYGYIIKPVSSHNLRAAIEMAINKHDLELLLKESELRYQTIFKSTSEAILVIDFETKKVVDTNPAFFSLLKYDQESVSRLQIATLFDSEPDEIDFECARIVECKHVQMGERRLHGLDGSLIDVEIDASNIMNGKQTAICFILHDITSRKRLEESLRLTQYFIDHSKEPILWSDQNAHLTYANQSACQLLGYSRDTLLGLSYYDIDPSVSNEIWKEQRTWIKQNGAVRLQTHYTCADTNTVPVEVTLDHLQYLGEEYIFIFFSDTSDQSQWEDTIVKRESYYRGFIEKNPEGLLLVDAHGLVLDCNQSILQLTELSWDAVCGHPINRLYYRLLPSDVFHRISGSLGEMLFKENNEDAIRFIKELSDLEFLTPAGKTWQANQYVIKLSLEEGDYWWLMFSKNVKK